MIVNALAYAPPAAFCNSFCLVGADDANGAYKIVDAAHKEIDFARLYLTDLSIDDEIIDGIAERVLEKKSRLLVRAAQDLNEVGQFDVRFHLSPVMLLHRLGLLERLDGIVGGVCLDKDDVDLMVQCNCPLILTPSYDMGKGHGIPDAVLYRRRGLRMGLGTEDGAFNPRGDVTKEADLLRLTMNALMHSENALGEDALCDMLAFA